MESITCFAGEENIWQENKQPRVLYIDSYRQTINANPAKPVWYLSVETSDDDEL